MDFERRFNEWIELNPLRQYKKANKVRYGVLGAMLGKSPNTLKRWEHGEGIPDFEALSKILGKNIEDRWKEWEKKKPSL